MKKRKRHFLKFASALLFLTFCVVDLGYAQVIRHQNLATLVRSDGAANTLFANTVNAEKTNPLIDTVTPTNTRISPEKTSTLSETLPLLLVFAAGMLLWTFSEMLGPYAKTFKIFLALTMGGAAGTFLRYKISNLALRHFGDRFPFGTLIVNLTGTFFVGFVMKIYPGNIDLAIYTHYFLVAGFAGAFTTFSTLMFESSRLFSQKERKPFFSNLALSILGGLLVFKSGMALASFFGIYLSKTTPFFTSVTPYLPIIFSGIFGILSVVILIQAWKGKIAKDSFNQSAILIAGGILGTLLRGNFFHLFIGTIAVNLIGSFAIGFFLSKMKNKRNHQLFFITGLSGAFTTFSTFIGEGVFISSPIATGVYFIANLVLGMILFRTGMKVEKQISTKKESAKIFIIANVLFWVFVFMPLGSSLGSFLFQERPFVHFLAWGLVNLGVFKTLKHILGFTYANPTFKNMAPKQAEMNFRISLILFFFLPPLFLQNSFLFILSAFFIQIITPIIQWLIAAGITKLRPVALNALSSSKIEKFKEKFQIVLKRIIPKSIRFKDLDLKTMNGDTPAVFFRAA